MLVKLLSRDKTVHLNWCFSRCCDHMVDCILHIFDSRPNVLHVFRHKVFENTLRNEVIQNG